MTEISVAQQLERLFEPAARAARRGDADQIRKVLESVRSIWKSSRKHRQPDANEERARGMTFAIEGILGIVLASAGADARHSLLEGRKYALPMLHALGKRARANLNDPAAVPDAALQKGELAKTVGAQAQNIGDLITAMSDCGLVSVSEKGAARRVSITDIGAQMLEAAKPGWQIKEVEQETTGAQIDEYVRRFQEQIEARGCDVTWSFVDVAVLGEAPFVARLDFGKRTPFVKTVKRRPGHDLETNRYEDDLKELVQQNAMRSEIKSNRSL